MHRFINFFCRSQPSTRSSVSIKDRVYNTDAFILSFPVKSSLPFSKVPKLVGFAQFLSTDVKLWMLSKWTELQQHINQMTNITIKTIIKLPQNWYYCHSYKISYYMTCKIPPHQIFIIILRSKDSIYLLGQLDVELTMFIST